MFAYGNNNPINLVDYTGERPVAYMIDLPVGTAIPIPLPLPLPLPLPADDRVDVSTDIKIWVESQKGLEEYYNNSVYVLRDPNDNNLVKYIGRTNDPGRRQQEHRNDLGHPWRRNYEMVVLATGLTVDKAKVLEQVLISAYTVGYLENARREIAIKNIPKFKSYVNATAEILTGIPGDTLYELIARR